MARAKFAPNKEHIEQLRKMKTPALCKQGHVLNANNTYIGESKGKPYVRCRECQRRTQKNYKQKNRPSSHQTERRCRLRRLYGITPEMFDSILKSQGYCCAVCKSPHPKSKRWSVDHDHKTGKIRALLCAPCNVAIGMAKDNALLLKQMAEYLEKHKEA